MNKNDVIKKLGLIPLEGEGGFYKRTFEFNLSINNRSINTSIYYLLTPDCFSCMHVLDGDEVYYYHDGPALEMLLVYPDHSEIVKIGKDVLNGEYPQYTVPKGVYQGSHMLNNDGEYTLVSTSNIPAYIDEGFKAGTYDELKDRCKDKLDLLKLLTSTPISK